MKEPRLWAGFCVYQPGDPVCGGGGGVGALFPWGPMAFPMGVVALAILFTSFYGIVLGRGVGQVSRGVVMGWGRTLCIRQSCA
jgi:hypothetical protein